MRCASMTCMHGGARFRLGRPVVRASPPHSSLTTWGRGPLRRAAAAALTFRHRCRCAAAHGASLRHAVQGRAAAP